MSRDYGRWSLVVGLLVAALAVACASGGDSDDDDSGGDDDYDPNQGPESSSDDDDDDDDDDDAGDDDDNDTSSADDDADDEMSCAEVWLECEYENPRDGFYEDECPMPDVGDPDFASKMADYQQCYNELLAKWNEDMHDCGVDDGCDDYLAEYYACMTEWYEDVAYCYENFGPDCNEFMPDFGDYQCGNL